LQDAEAAPRWSHYVNDAAGAPDRLLGSGGDVASTWGRTAWGSTAGAAPQGFGSQIRFQGQYDDVETDLFYNRFRYYDPDAARFVSPDPIGLAGGLNLQRYVPNPFNWADPLGLGTVNFAGSPALYPAGPGQSNTVTIPYTGSRAQDFAAANKAACIQSPSGNYTQKPPVGPNGEKYTWHHVADYDPATNTGTMQLVLSSAHGAVGHSGGVAQYTAAHGGPYG
jgi:RHS repeat-associated protein